MVSRKTGQIWGWPLKKMFDPHVDFEMLSIFLSNLSCYHFSCLLCALYALCKNLQWLHTVHKISWTSQLKCDLWSHSFVPFPLSTLMMKPAESCSLALLSFSHMFSWSPPFLHSPKYFNVHLYITKHQRACFLVTIWLQCGSGPHTSPLRLNLLWVWSVDLSAVCPLWNCFTQGYSLSGSRTYPMTRLMQRIKVLSSCSLIDNPKEPC